MRPSIHSRLISWLLLLALPLWATDIREKYGTSNQTITITLASLASDTTGARTGRQSTEVDNTTNLFFDALVQLKVKTGASGTTTTGHVDIYLFSTADNGTTRTETAGATDNAITLTDTPNAKKLAVCMTVANATTYNCGPYSVAEQFGGMLPPKWGVIVINESGGTLDTTGGNHAMFYQGVLAQTP